MKSKILKLCTAVLLFLFFGAGCQKDEFEYADEDIILSSNPGFFVFKTKNNYKDKIWVQITPEGLLNAIPTLTGDTPNIKIDKEGNVSRTNLYLLKSGYIVGPAHQWAAYTDITLTEYLQYNRKNNINHWSDELLWPRIVDKDPYLELYGVGCLNCNKKYSLGEINEMLEDNTIEKHFTKLK